jgi:hypothetical protein
VTAICAVPAGSRWARSQVDAFAALDAAPGLLLLRGDRQATIGAVWRALVTRADWRTRTVTVTWSTVQAQSGRSRATVARALAWLRGAGLLGIVHTGASAAAIGGDTNRCPTYVLAVPLAGDQVDERTPAQPAEPAQSLVDELETPTGPVGSVSRPYAGAREDDTPAGPDGPSATRNPAPTSTTRPSWSLSAAPSTRAEQLAAAEALRYDAVTLRPMSARLIRHVLRPWFVAGWSPRDVLHALDHTPDGQPWRYAGMPRATAAWARYRLGAWLDDTGTPLPSRSQRARRP